MFYPPFFQMSYQPFYSNVLAAIFFSNVFTRHLFKKNFPAIFFKCFTRHFVHIFWVSFPNVSPAISLKILPNILCQMLGPQSFQMFHLPF
jgi:hypothetical protein